MDLTAPSWLVNMLQHVSLWDAILGFIFGVGVFWFIKKRGWRWVIAFARAILATAEVIDNVRELPEFIKRTDAALGNHSEQLTSIYHETHNNDGSSIKDAVDRVEIGVKGLYTQTDTLQSGVEGLHGRMDAVEADVKALHQADEAIRDDIGSLEETLNPKETQ